jgi:hypothetical protein
MHVQMAVKLLSERAPVKGDGRGRYWADIGDRRVEVDAWSGEVAFIHSFPPWADEEARYYVGRAWPSLEEAIAAAVEAQSSSSPSPSSSSSSSLEPVS